jgi:hypothetical protein
MICIMQEKRKSSSEVRKEEEMEKRKWRETMRIERNRHHRIESSQLVLLAAPSYDCASDQVAGNG